MLLSSIFTGRMWTKKFVVGLKRSSFDKQVLVKTRLRPGGVNDLNYLCVIRVLVYLLLMGLKASLETLMQKPNALQKLTWIDSQQRKAWLVLVKLTPRLRLFINNFIYFLLVVDSKTEISFFLPCT